MPDTMPIVEMHGCYIWDCPVCGIENIQRHVTRFLDKDDPEDAAIIESMYGPEKLHNERALFRAVSHPDTVRCKECKTTFRSCSPDVAGADDEEEFDSDMEL